MLGFLGETGDLARRMLQGIRLPRMCMSDAFIANTVDTTFGSQSQVDVSEQLASLERHG